ncbi:uncharacterized protein METZ01_LOCUS163122, partial [marine metagenome]
MILFKYLVGSVKAISPVNSTAGMSA